MFADCIYFDKTKNHKVFAGVLIAKEEQILLGLKNYGFGKGKWQHSFAGKVESGEAIVGAAKRELHEESGLIVESEDLEKVGYFEYEFTDSDIAPWILEVHIYRALAWEGEPVSCEEISPKWFSKQEIPLDCMWKDNQHWLETVLEGNKVQGYFLYSDYENIERFEVHRVDNLDDTNTNYGSRTGALCQGVEAHEEGKEKE